MELECNMALTLPNALAPAATMLRGLRDVQSARIAVGVGSSAVARACGTMNSAV
jgi:hypothetical protein